MKAGLRLCYALLFLDSRQPRSQQIITASHAGTAYDWLRYCQIRMIRLQIRSQSYDTAETTADLRNRAVQ